MATPVVVVKQTSPVWKYFKINADDSKVAECKLCGAKVSRGGAKTSSFNTSNLLKHLKVYHENEHKEIEATALEKRKLLQPTLQQTLQKSEKLKSTNPRALQITRAVAEMIALANLPLSFVENVGFRRFMQVVEPKYEVPSRATIVRTVMPQVHDSVKKHVSSLLCDAPAISFTTDIWSSSVSPLSLISQTARWIDDNFQLHSVMLHAKEFRGSHTGEAIAAKFEEMLNTWNIPKEAVHVVLRDNAKNMIKGMGEAELRSLPCVAHTLQLTVNEGLLAQKCVSDAVAIGRKIVGHFQHSPLAYSKLQDIQMDMHKPIKRLAQNVPTRWNSTLYMMRSLLEQKQAIGVYGTENKLPDSLSVNKWSLFEKAVKLLEPFEELTRQVSLVDSSAADVIPAITALLRVLEEDCEEDRGVGSMKNTLLQAARKRFADIERNSLYSFAAILDPR